MKKIVCLIACLMLCLCASGAMADTEGDFEYSVSDGEATVTGYTGDAAELVVPETLGGYPVTSIGKHAFEDCGSLVSIDLPEGLKSIGDGAFYDCSSLTSIDLPEGLTSIGMRAFCGCSSIETVDLPDGVTSIKDGTFLLCSSLVSIDLPDGVTTVEDFAFRDCSSLASIDLPDSVTSIGGYAFEWCNSLVSIDLPEGLTSIGDYVFRSCGSLASIDIPDRLTSIGEGAFSYCVSLELIDLPDSLVSIGERTFEVCENLKWIDLPDELKRIEYYAFSECRALASIQLPEGLLSIGEGAFRNCGLNMIHLPEGLETIGKNAFEVDHMQSLTIPSSVTSIPYPIADDCRGLTSVVLPKELTEIAKDAFPDSVLKVYCYKNSAADVWAQETGRFVIYLDSYDIAKDIQLITPESDGWLGYEERVFEVGRPIVWNKDYYVAPQALGQTYTLRCESSDSSIAQVDGEWLTFLENGNVTLTVTVEEFPELSSSFEVESYYPVESFTFPTAVFVREKEHPIIPVENIMPKNANPYFVLRSSAWSMPWQGEYNAVRMVRSPAQSSTGVVRVRVQSASPSNNFSPAWDTEPYAQSNLVIYDTVNAIAAAAPSRNLETGEIYQPDITVTVDNLPFVNEPAAYTLKSSKTSVVRPTDDGRLEAVAPGTATITATTFDGSKTAKFNVTVVKATTLRIPAGTKRIEDEAFIGVAAATVIIPDGCESIGARAFADCENLIRAEIPESVTEIADDAFGGCPAGFVIAAPEGSYAAEYAATHGYAE